MQIEAVQIDEGQIDTLQPLWLQLHAHHQSVAPELRPFVDPVTSWKARRDLYIHAVETGGIVRVARDGERQVGYLVTSWEPSPWPATLVSPEIAVCRDRGFLPGWLQLSRFKAGSRG